MTAAVAALPLLFHGFLSLSDGAGAGGGGEGGAPWFDVTVARRELVLSFNEFARVGGLALKQGPRLRGGAESVAWVRLRRAAAPARLGSACVNRGRKGTRRS